MPKYKFDIAIVGVGMGGVGNTTVRTMKILKRSRIVFSLSVRSAWVKKHCRKMIDLDDEYFTGEEDSKIYRRLANRILREGAEKGGVVLIDDGHPFYFDDVCHDIAKRGRRRGLNILACPGISSLDVMMANCGVKIDAIGCQIVEAATLVEEKQRINPTFETVVLQIGWLGCTHLDDSFAVSSKSLKKLEKHLLKFYPPKHKVHIIRVPISGSEKTENITCRLDKLSKYKNSFTRDASMHIKPLSLE